tara:strand:+ start:283 stop:573 length:291 start_codon:yes stop_codon:yes gene_type:complete
MKKKDFFYKGDCFETQWGYFHGYGMMESDLGRYIGEFKNNKMNGQGKLVSKEGIIMEGIWKDNNFVSSKIIPNDELLKKYNSLNTNQSILKLKTED